MPFKSCKDCGYVAPVTYEAFNDPNGVQCEECYEKAVKRWMDTWTYRTTGISFKQFAIHPDVSGWKRFCLMGLARQYEGNVAAVLKTDAPQNVDFEQHYRDYFQF